MSNWPAKLSPKPFCRLHECGHSSIQKVLQIKLKQGNIDGSILRQHKEAESENCRVNINDLLTGLLGLYYEIRSLIIFVRPELVRAVLKSEGFIFLVWTE